LHSGETLEVFGEGIRGQRPGGEDDDPLGGNLADFTASEFDEGVVGEGFGEVAAEDGAIDGEGASGGNLVSVGGFNDDRPELAQFFVEESGGAIAGLGAEGVGTDQFGEFFGMVGGTSLKGAHFVKHHGDASPGNLPGGFGSGESAADDVDGGGLEVHEL